MSPSVSTGGTTYTYTPPTKSVSAAQFGFEQELASIPSMGGRTHFLGEPELDATETHAPDELAEATPDLP